LTRALVGDLTQIVGQDAMALIASGDRLGDADVDEDDAVAQPLHLCRVAGCCERGH
jgi:hypothetical protein